MIINFITNTNIPHLLNDIDKLYNIFFIKYNTGNMKKFIYHYLEYKSNHFSHINIFYGFINNSLLNTSNNNFFVYIEDFFSNYWLSLLQNYNKIIIFNQKYFKLFKNHNSVHYLDFYNSDLNKIYQSFYLFSKNISFNHNLFKLSYNDLPYVSICLLTHNRYKFIKYLFNNYYYNNNYPSNKIEYIIIDDGNQNIIDFLPKNHSNIKYHKYPNKQTISWKRNKAVELSKYNIIAFIDDDDYYPPESLYLRIYNLLKSKKKCIFCSTLGSFDIINKNSIIQSTNIYTPLHKRVSEATLTFFKDFWLEKKFNNDDFIEEGSYFIFNREEQCLDISFHNIIIHLLHNNNTIPKYIDKQLNNGSHFNFSDNIFQLIMSLI